VRLLIIDEAHMVDQDLSKTNELYNGSSRSLRLEQLGVRILRAQSEYNFRIIALSAVAANSAPAMSRWFSCDIDALPVTSRYRSTRQMVGQLEVSTAGNYLIRYKLMDSCSLKFDDETKAETPYVADPIPKLPGGIDADLGPEVSMRAPTLWAAIHLASEHDDGTRPSVLISITSSIENFISTCADLMDLWSKSSLPNYRHIDTSDDLWNKTLSITADYFSVESYEYRLIKHGIAVHHGKMPGLLSRRIKKLINRGDLRVVIATSTLSEGVNIPVTYLLVPSLWRGMTPLSLQEFSNLSGRVGRPGVSTEGSTLVVLPERKQIRRFGRAQFEWNREWNRFEEIVKELDQLSANEDQTPSESNPRSPIAYLILALKEAWTELTGEDNDSAFHLWLEKTAVDDGNINEVDGVSEDEDPAYALLGSLDTILIALIQEVEELKQSELEPNQIEAELKIIWQRTYAYATKVEEQQLSTAWVKRGRTIKLLYPDSKNRRQIYRSSLSPRSANILINIEDNVKSLLVKGKDYALWEDEKRLNFLIEVISLLSEVPSFKIGTNLGRRRTFTDWEKILKWWLLKDSVIPQPKPKEITEWFQFVSQNFIYRSVWAVGSILGLIMDSSKDDEKIEFLEVGDWPNSGLPWIAFWIKEIITWGTLDPVAAFLMAHDKITDRKEASSLAQSYYKNFHNQTDPNSILDPRSIRDWMFSILYSPIRSENLRTEEINVTLSRRVTDYISSKIIVLPVEINKTLIWITPSGYKVAENRKSSTALRSFSNFEFELDVVNSKVVAVPYI
jgi:hypothetical protein